MKSKYYLAAAILAASLTLGAQPRTETPLLNDWKFSIAMYGDFKQYDSFSDGPVSAFYDDSNWKTVNLPNDWAVDMPDSPAASYHNGHKSIGWQYVDNSTAFYRKHFDVAGSEKGRTLKLKFEKIAGRSEMYLNGLYIGGSQTTQAPFEIEVGDYLKYGGENVLVVKVDAFCDEAATYRGAGIIGNVSLLSCGKLCLAESSFRLENTNRIGTNSYMLDVCASVENSSDKSEGMCGITFYLDDERGRNVSQTQTFYSVIPQPGQSLKVQRQLNVANPSLWSDYRPYLYTLRCELTYDNATVDAGSVKVGVRDVEIDPVSGISLNGKAFTAFGAYVRPGFGGVGTGVPAQLWESRLKTLKSLGCNLLRFTDGCASAAALDACDRLGILVIEDCGASPENGAANIGQMVGRDASHPCLIAWNIEPPHWAWKDPELAAALCDGLSSRISALDASRPAGSYSGNQAWAKDLFSVPAFNYRGSEEPADWPANITCGGLVDYSGHVTPEGEEMRLRATGKNSKAFLKEEKNAPKAGRPFRVVAETSSKTIAPDGQSIVVIDVTVLDEKDRICTGLPQELTVYVDANPLSPYGTFMDQEKNPMYEPVTLLGYSNGDPAFSETERPLGMVVGEFHIKTYKGRAQILLRSVEGSKGKCHVRVGGERLHGSSLTFDYK